MRRRSRLAILLGIFILVLGGTYYLLRKPAQEITAAAPPIEDVVQNVLAARTREILAQGAVPFGETDVINVLVLGIDSRKEGEDRHCDAIHMFSVNVKTWTVLVTSVPRGTYSYIPPGNYASTEYYLANACAFAGLDYGIDQIERVLGVKADYVVTAGFSQVLGTLRVLGLPTTSSLQWLRHRQSYRIGDPQRSHNQALFLVDVLNRFATEDARVSATLQYILYSFVDTNMEFGTARTLYEGLAAANVGSHPESITFAMKPYHETADYHLDFENPDEQIAKLLDRIRPYLSKADLSGRTLADVQEELVLYLNEALLTDDGVALVVSEETWRQVEDEEQRETLHYAFMERRVRTLVMTEKETAVRYVADYVVEKQALGLAAWEEKGRALLAEIVVQ